MKKAVKYAKKTYKNIPKKKILGKAGIFAAKKIIGGPYLELANVVYSRTKKSAIKYAGTYAYEQFFRSKYARDHINTVPMTIFSTVLRFITNFLILSRIKTGNWWIDFPVSILVTVIVTVLSPIFYRSVEAHKDIFMHYTNSFVDQMMGPRGWEYLEMTKNKVLVFVGLLLLLVLQVVEINSWYVQEMIIHTIITGFISDQIQKWIKEISQPVRFYIGITYYEPAVPYILSEKNWVITAIPYSINTCHTDNRIIQGVKPRRAKVVSQDDIKKIKIKKYEKSERKPEFISIIDDYLF